MRRFQINLQGLYMQSGAKPIESSQLSQLNQVNLHPARHKFKRRPTQLNLSPIGARNQRKFAPNPSPIQIGFYPAHQLVFSV